MVARRSIVAAVAPLCVSFALLLAGASAALAVEPPLVEGESALDVAGTSATLQATIDPEGSETIYRFEYGPTEAYGSSVPVPDGLVGSGLSGVTVSAHVQGLAPGTIYHYRVVAVVASRGESVTAGDANFTTQQLGGELSLLDGRQWQLVSPPNKHGAKIMPIDEVGVIQAADDGHAITYLANAPTELEPQGLSNEVQVFSTRASGGWSSQDIATPHNAATGLSIGQGNEYRSFSSDLSLALVEPQGPFTPLSTEATERTPYIRDDAACSASPATCYTPLVTAGNVAPGAKFGGNGGRITGEAKFEGGTSDFTHIVLRSEVGLTSTPGDEGGLYEWADGQIRLVSVLPESEGGTPQGIVSLGHASVGEDKRNAISSDGSRIFWTTIYGGDLYMRDMVRNETIRIGSGEAAFQIASVDGSRVFFSTESGTVLEECDIVEVGGKLTCEPTQLASGLLGAVLGVSEDGSYVYFVSNSQLAPGAVAGACTNLVGSTALCNLYVERNRRGVWEGPRLIGVLSAADSPDWKGSGADALTDLTARVTGNGHWLAFMSQRSLTGYDTHDAASSQPDEEVYLYDGVSERLACASCNPTGDRPSGSAYQDVYQNQGLLGGGDRVWSSGTWIAANIPGWTPYALARALYQSRYLSDSGRLFFNSGDALTPQDVNGTWDVYEYEPPGVGGCTAAAPTFDSRSDGCVGLVSSGGSAEQSAFMDASESGDDVFFLTTSHLSAEDFDTSLDIYDAHVCSASVPCASAPVSPPPCSTGDSCKAAPSPQPGVFGAPSSATFAGIGNVAEASERAAPRSLSRAQRLKRALKACRRKKDRRRRAACERRARRQYRANKATRGSK